ncbi:SHOCT domain-containing protein [Mycobacterium sp. IDR2000157661]|uniref:SHOCT domain-containing protein n=1 Tax=Mycobacterium sp. IDR2000157661 TaxID=2867005 RepID=UPI00351CC479
MFWYGHDMGWWGYAGMGIGMVLFWTLVVVGIVALIRVSLGAKDSGSTASMPPQQHYRVPEEILADRFARGEIDEADYENRLRLLHEHSRP